MAIIVIIIVLRVSRVGGVNIEKYNTVNFIGLQVLRMLFWSSCYSNRVNININKYECACTMNACVHFIIGFDDFLYVCVCWTVVCLQKYKNWKTFSKMVVCIACVHSLDDNNDDVICRRFRMKWTRGAFTVFSRIQLVAWDEPVEQYSCNITINHRSVKVCSMVRFSSASSTFSTQQRMYAWWILNVKIKEQPDKRQHFFFTNSTSESCRYEIHLGKKGKHTKKKK